MDWGCCRRMMNTITTPLLPQPLDRHRGDSSSSIYSHSSTDIEAGFTLIEVLVVIAVAAILLSIALPNLGYFIANGRISTASNDLASDLMFARSLASSNQYPAVVCPSNAPAINTLSPTSCAATVSCSVNPNDWVFLGRIVFIDKNFNGKCDGSETIIRYTAPTLTPDASSKPTSIVPNFPSNNWIAFNPYGAMISPAPAGAISSGNFKLCVKGATQCRQIAVDFSGRPSVKPVPW
ncbi:type II transport protein GspH [mine drainage metagenome]|uniref:Type II transport protein GspH n=1 Tax=mine drainage metagenome TaxID=410659 RepID=A0A1J5SA43_9ZZZZ